jgi:hypothetical protein
MRQLIITLIFTISVLWVLQGEHITGALILTKFQHYQPKENTIRLTYNKGQFLIDKNEFVGDTLYIVNETYLPKIFVKLYLPNRNDYKIIETPLKEKNDIEIYIPNINNHNNNYALWISYKNNKDKIINKRFLLKQITRDEW